MTDERRFGEGTTDNRVAEIVDSGGSAEPWEVASLAAEVLARRAGDRQRRDPTPEGTASVVARVKPLLANLAPELQAAVLADLFALWLAGHPNDLREPLIVRHLNAVRSLVPVNERALFGESGHPGNIAVH